MRKVLFAGVLLMALATAPDVIALEAQVTSSVENGNQWITVKGSTNNAFENVSVQIVRPGCEIEPDMSQQDYINSIMAMTTVTSDSQNSFSRRFRVAPDTQSGLYTINLKAADGDHKVIPYEIITLATLLEKQEDLSTLADEAEIERILADYGKALGLDLTEYGKLDEDDKTKALKLFVANRNATGKTTFTVKEIEELIKEASIITSIKESGQSKAAELIRFYELDIKLKETPVYKDFETKIKESDYLQICARIFRQKDEYASFAELRKAAELQILLHFVQHNDGWYTVRNIVQTYPAMLGINQADLDRLKNLKNPDKVYQALNGKEIYTATAFADAYDDAVKDASSQSNNKRGGGGSPSGSKGTVQFPVTLPQTPDTVQLQTDYEFEDVKRTASWASQAVKALSKKGIVNGKSKGVFAPNDFVTREEMAKLIVLMAGQKGDTSAESVFSDIEPGSWYRPFVSSARKLGLINGISHSYYGVGRMITRQDMAVMVYRAAKLMGADGEGTEITFEDKDEIAEYAQKAVAFLEKNKLINGKENFKFKPTESATRAEVAQIIYNVLKFLGKAE